MLDCCCAAATDRLGLRRGVLTPLAQQKAYLLQDVLLHPHHRRLSGSAAQVPTCFSLHLHRTISAVLEFKCVQFVIVPGMMGPPYAVADTKPS
jgi:hypothetical protein